MCILFLLLFVSFIKIEITMSKTTTTMLKMTNAFFSHGCVYNRTCSVTKPVLVLYLK